MECIPICERHKDVAMQLVTQDDRMTFTAVKYLFEMMRIELSEKFNSSVGRKVREEHPEVFTGFADSYEGFKHQGGVIARNGGYYCPVCGDELHRLVEKYLSVLKSLTGDA